ncbi:N-acetylglucosamine-6-phosphate deacetylase [Flindersiella endophytica]
MSSEPSPSTEVTGTDPTTGRTLRVTMAQGRITAIEPTAGKPGDKPGDKAPAWLTPGLVDVQVNGFAGYDVNAAPADAGPGAIVAMVHALFERGVTTVVPTVITSAEDQIVAALRRIQAARAEDPLVAHAIPYAHVEGPHLSDQDGPRGVHPKEFLRPPDIAEFQRWQSASNNVVGMVTLSPHWPDSNAYIAELAGQGIHVAIGHTHATPEQITAAADAGATLSTHLGNGAHATIKRHPNYLWTQLADDRLAAGLIADGHHLPADTLTVMLRAKGEQAFLVSDAVALAGERPGVYQTPVGGEVELTADGRLSYAGTPLLAGAARPLSDCVARVANLPGHSLGDAVRLATRSPGRLVGGGRGALRVGAPADLIRFRWLPGDEALVIEQVFVTGTAITTPSS